MWFVLCASLASAQTTYHLHAEASTTAGRLKLITAGPDAATSFLQSADLKSAAVGEKLVKEWDTPTGIPGTAGAIAMNQTITLVVWMKKTANQGLMVPRAKVFLNSAAGASLCTATGGSPLSITLTNYSLMCTVPASVPITATDRFYVWLGVNLTTASAAATFKAEADIEGTLNGSNDTRITIPPIMPPPTITSLTPPSGAIGQNIVITGTNFGATQAAGASTVKFFNNLPATIVNWAATSITATVPASAADGNVTVTVAGQAANSVFDVVPRPTITSLSPTTGTVGTALTINGTNFGNPKAPTSTVTINGTPVTAFTSWIATKIVCTVPAGATTGPVVVTVGNAPNTGTTTFTVTGPPQITNVSPASASNPTQITITGTSFGNSQITGSLVKFNTLTASVASWSNTSILLTVPAAAVSGSLTVTTSAGGVSNAWPFSAPPNITSITPNPAGVGAAVAVNGTNFGTAGTLTFNGTQVTPTSWITTKVMLTAGITGPVIVTVNGVSSASTPFTLVPALLLSTVVPDHASVGSTVTLYGLNFGSSQGASTLKVNGVTVTTINSWSDNEISAVIPTGAPATGNIVLSVAGLSGSIPFTVEPRPNIASLSPNQGPAGTVVTIAGTAFGSSASYDRGGNTVTFNGIIATVTSWSDTSIVVTSPLGATTGPVIVTRNIDTSNSSTFTVPAAPFIQSLSPIAAAPGATVIVRGVNLGSTGSLKFNGTVANVTNWTSSSLTTTVPPLATSGPVVATVGLVASNGMAFSVLGTGTIAGAITQSAGGAAIQGATVQAMQTGVVKGTATSSVTGAYTIGALPSGTYDLKVTAAGLGTRLTPDIAIANGATATVNVTLSAAGAVGGTITQSDLSTPVPNAGIVVYRGSTALASVTSTTIGTYSIPGLSADSYRLEVAAAGFVTQSQPSVSVVSGGTTTLNVGLSGPGLAPINYVYDELGRLASVIDRAGDAAVYNYDAVGNLLSIDRINASTVSIVSFLPSSGPVGTVVMVSGTGFSPILAQNAVTVNGTAATVAAASATELTITVPGGATTGPIAVTSPSGTAGSTGPFTVADTGAPTITGVNPPMADPGSTITITGTNFTSPADSSVIVKLNGTVLSFVSSVTPTAIEVVLPQDVTSGKLTVATPFGLAVSANDFFVISSTFAGFTGRMTVGGSLSVPLDQGAYVLFDGTAGQRVAFVVSGASGCSGYLRHPDNGFTNLALPCPGGSSGPTDVVTLPLTGTYMIAAGGSGTATLSLLVVPPNTVAPIVPGGAPVTVTSSVPGPQSTLTFNGVIGQSVTLEVSGNTYGSCWLYLNPPTGFSIVSSPCPAPGGYFAPAPLLSGGQYSLVIQPWNGSTGSLTVALTAAATAPITIDGPPVTVSTAAAGQTAHVSFSGTAGQRLFASVTNDSFACGAFQLIRPDGTIEVNAMGGPCAGQSTSTMDLPILPVTGTWSLLRNPAGLTTGSGTFALATVPADASGGDLSVGGPPASVTVTASGQRAFFTFSGTISETVTIQVTGNTIANAGIRVIAPDGNLLPEMTLSGSTLSFTTGTLQNTGTYTIMIDPSGTNVGSVTIGVVTP
jgi:YD repeat-containing protein